MILLDTNILVALTDADDRHHRRCVTWVDKVGAPLMVPATVLAEACYLVDREMGPSAETALLDDVGIGSEYFYQFIDLIDADLRRMAELVRRYADRRMGATTIVPG